MQRDIKHFSGAVKGFLGPVAVMKIPINYHYFLNSPQPPQIFSCDGNVIEKAKTHWPVTFSMVAWGPDQGKSVVYFPVQDEISRHQPSPGRQAGNLVGVGASNSIRIKEKIVLTGRFLQKTDIRRQMNKAQFFFGGRTRSNRHIKSFQPRGQYVLQDNGSEW